MELKEFIKNFRKYKKRVLTCGGIGAFVGLAAFYTLPVNYYAVGTLFVSHDSEFNQKADFTYEGYYAQQTAKNYTKTLIGILESPDVRKKALEKIGAVVNEKSLRQAKRQVTVKEPAPQLVSVVVKDKDYGRAQVYWGNLTELATSSSNQLNLSSGELINISVLEGSPVVYKGFHNVWFNLVAGLSFGLFFGFAAVLLKEYLK
uniref:Polysaccharide chain length determinant N-terminal domain-containing protein n=1 Tax=candidate division WWE3 bacterium TaxID=2053526 RepID=A0A7C4TR55_UNCKA